MYPDISEFTGKFRKLVRTRKKHLVIFLGFESLDLLLGDLEAARLSYISEATWINSQLLALEKLWSLEALG